MISFFFIVGSFGVNTPENSTVIEPEKVIHFFSADPEKRKVYDERGEKGVTGEDKDMTDKEGEGGGCGCCCGAKAYIEKFGFAAYAAMTGMVSDSEEEDSEEEEPEPEEESDEEDIEADSSGVNVNPMNIRPMYGNPMNGGPRPMYGNPMNGGPRPIYGNPMNGGPRPMYGNPMNVRPIYNVNNPNIMNVVRPIIINGVQVGTYMRPANPIRQPASTAGPSGPASSTGKAGAGPTDPKIEERKRKVDDVLNGAAKKFREGVTE